VEAETTDEQQSVRMANAATDALLKHVLNLNRRANVRDKLLADYKRAALKVAQLKLAVAKRPRNVSLRQRYQVALLRQNALGNLYYPAAAGEVSQNLLQVIVRAAHGESDRNDELEKWGLIGALAGFLVGLALVAGRESRVNRRATTA
jgi:hypothetical protein